MAARTARLPLERSGGAQRIVACASIAVAALIATAMAATVASAADRPNVVVILTDDQGWGDLSVQGNTNLHTPRIDALARSGATFERFFVCPLCAPTRAEFLTGRYHPRSGVRGVSTGLERLDVNAKTIADAFHAAGYATGAFGKWHNGSQWPYHPRARGFDEYYGFTSGHWGEYFDPPLEHDGVFVRGKGYIADDLANHAIEFIEQNAGRPFFCYVPFNTPHSPFCVPDAYWDRHKDNPVPMRGPYGDKEDLAVTRSVLAMCENIDWNVGRVLDKLDALRLTDNTIVVYFADNGPASSRWNGGMKGQKGTTDEGGVRVPCFVRWPGKIKPGLVTPRIAGAIDLLPTLTSLAGIRPVGDQPLDGMDLSPLLFDSGGEWPERMLFSHQSGRVSVRTQQYRLDHQGALFDMRADPGQTRNVAAQQPEVASRLRQAVADWRADVLPPSQTDDRAYPVGYREFPMTPLPARDGVAHGGVRRSSPAPNCSYFVHWTSPEDSITWDVDVHTAGAYGVTIYYTCPEADAGSLVEVSFKDDRLEGLVSPGWDPPLVAGQDRAPRKAESIMKEFHPLNLGTISLSAGRGLLTLRALRVPGKSVMDVRLVTLRLTGEPQAGGK